MKIKEKGLTGKAANLRKESLAGPGRKGFNAFKEMAKASDDKKGGKGKAKPRKSLPAAFPGLGRAKENSSVRKGGHDGAEREAEVDKGQILYGMDLGAPSAEPGDSDGETKEGDTGTRSVPLGSRVFYTAEEVRAFRTPHDAVRSDTDTGQWSDGCCSSGRS